MNRGRDDLWTALDIHPPKAFNTDDIVQIIAEVPGENDEFSWWWLLRLTNHKFALVSAWCDFTGWDCQSGVTVEEIRETIADCLDQAPIRDGSRRRIRENLTRQITGEQAKFTYVEEPNDR